MTGKVLSTPVQMYVSKAFLPRGRRPHVKQLCARTCPVLPVQRKLCKNISSSDRYHFVKNIHRSITKKDSTDVSATPVSRKVLSCIFIDTQEADDHSLYNHCQYCFSTSPRLLSMPFSKLLFKNLHPPFSENFLFGIANRNVASLRQ